MQKFIKFKINFLIICASILIILINLSALYLFSSGPLEENKLLIIERSTTQEISEKLAKENIIKYPKFFLFLAKIYNIKISFKSGQYLFTSQISPMQVIKTLTIGKSVVHKFRVEEGATVYKVIKELKENNLLFGEIENYPKEGSLMPNTYFYSYGDKRVKILNQMTKLMSDHVEELMKNLDPSLPIKNANELIIMASIIEKEAVLKEDKPIIAGIFYNRLKKNMPLQSDVTVIYALTEGKSNLNRKLKRSDLRIDSPYNSFNFKGLPQGPICCPSLESLKSAAKPAKTDMLYFVGNGQGGHYFAKTLEAHNKYVLIYREYLKKTKQLKEAEIANF